MTGARSLSVKEAAGGETGVEQRGAGGGSFGVPRHLPAEASHVPPYALN